MGSVIPRFDKFVKLFERKDALCFKAVWANLDNSRPSPSAQFHLPTHLGLCDPIDDAPWEKPPQVHSPPKKEPEIDRHDHPSPHLQGGKGRQIPRKSAVNE